MFSIPFDIDKEIEINKSRSEVFQFVSNFMNWPNWSPWLCQEPDCDFSVDGNPAQVGHKQSWNGKYIGSGNMTLESLESDKKITYQLEFLKPWKSRSKVEFIFEKSSSNPDGSLVRWTMNGSLPIFMVFFKKMMKALVENDYERGLKMLKEHLETGQVHTKVIKVGLIDQSPVEYFYSRATIPIKEIGKRMEDDFKVLSAWTKQKSLKDPDYVFAIYHKFDFVKGDCDYSSAFGYKEQMEAEGEGLIQKSSFPSHKALQYNHIGPYRHLGNAWSAVMGCQRGDGLKIRKDISPYEFYVNDPTSVDEKDLKTEIYVPLRS
jgi:effector-binding domain-containing protein